MAICRLHGFLGTPTAENQLKALDKELHQLKEQGQSGKAAHVQTLFIWLSKKAGKGLLQCNACHNVLILGLVLRIVRYSTV